MKAASELSQDVGRKLACEGLGVPRATFYRHLDRENTTQALITACGQILLYPLPLEKGRT